MKSRYVIAGIVVIALVLATIGLLQVVSADYDSNVTKNWVGSIDGNWETAGNWNPSGVPGVGDDVIINVGSVTISSAQSVASLTLSGGTLTGAGDLAISGLFTWSGGTMSGDGVATANGGISITSSAAKELNRTLNNNGTCTCDYSGSSFVFYLYGIFNNQAGATFNLPTDVTIGSYGAATFNNYGTFNRTTSGGTAIIQVAFKNYGPSGTVNVQTGTLELAGTGTHTGLFNVAAGATLSFPATHALNAGSNVTGAGTVSFSSGSTITIAGSYDLTGPTNVSGYGLDINSDITIASAINFSGSSTLGGTGNVTLTGLFTWSGGTLGGSGTTTANGGMSIAGTAGKTLNRTLNNNGTCTCDYSGSSFVLYLSGIFNNQAGATFNLPTDVTIGSYGAATFNNHGTFNRTTSSGTAVMGLPFNNSGTVNVQSGTLSFANTYTQTAGSIVLDGGSVTTSNPLDIQGGSLKGCGNITGGVSIGASGAVDIELGGTTPGTGAGNYDQLNISGTTTLGGTLNVTLTGGFAPAVADNFTIMTYASCTGTFATTNLAAPGGGRAWDAVAYNPASVVLSVIAGTNHAPAAPTGGVSYSTSKDAVLNQAAPGVLGGVTDSDSDPLTAILVSNVSHGTLVLNADGSFAYTPATGFTGTDSFTCKANDGTADSSVFTVTIAVTAGESPTITALSKTGGRQGQALTVVITGTNLGGATAMDLGKGITVGTPVVASSTEISVEITIASDAELGARDVTVNTTGGGTFTLEDGFTVEKAKSEGAPVWVWPVVVVAVLAAGGGGFFLFLLLRRRKNKRT